MISSIFSFSPNVFESHLPQERQKLSACTIRVNPFPNKKILDSFKMIAFAGDNPKFDGMVDSSPNGYKTLWVKEKLLVMSNFSFSHSVFERLVLKCRQIKT